MNKHTLCETFCHDLRITEVPAGFAVGTTFTYRDGDPLSFYITPPPHRRGDVSTRRLRTAGPFP